MMIYIVCDEKGQVAHMCETEQFAQNFITLYGNENFTIESEEMC